MYFALQVYKNSHLHTGKHNDIWEGVQKKDIQLVSSAQSYWQNIA